MTQKETVTRNIGLTFDFVHYLLDNKAEVAKLQSNFKLAFKEKDFPTLERKQPTQTPIQGIELRYARVKNTFDLL